MQQSAQTAAASATTAPPASLGLGNNLLAALQRGVIPAGSNSAYANAQRPGGQQQPAAIPVGLTPEAQFLAQLQKGNAAPRQQASKPPGGPSFLALLQRGAGVQQAGWPSPDACCVCTAVPRLCFIWGSVAG
jgi:hypothetical protein